MKFNGVFFEYKGKALIREIELLGDVEKVRWYLTSKTTGFLEVLDLDYLYKLEAAYEEMCQEALIPELFYI